MSFPRVRGDVPESRCQQRNSPLVFPACAGMFRNKKNREPPPLVFPACAGMFPGPAASNPLHIGFPRVRGDVPMLKLDCLGLSTFSPRARGCSGVDGGHEVSFRVFPACAGMFPRSFARFSIRCSFPRVRGDVPPRLMLPRSRSTFSPRARGCSLDYPSKLD